MVRKLDNMRQLLLQLGKVHLTEDEIWDYCDSLLDDEETRSSIATHLERCFRCRDQVRSIHEVLSPSWATRLRWAFADVVARGDAISQQLASSLRKGMEAGMKFPLALQVTLDKAKETGEVLKEKVADVMLTTNRWDAAYAGTAGEGDMDKSTVTVSTDIVKQATIKVEAAESKVRVRLRVDRNAELPLALLVPEDDEGEVYAASMEQLSPFMAEAKFEAVKDGRYLVVIQSA